MRLLNRDRDRKNAEKYEAIVQYVQEFVLGTVGLTAQRSLGMGALQRANVQLHDESVCT